MIKSIARFITPKKIQTCDIDKAATAVIGVVTDYIVPEKRFVVLKMVVETLFPAYRVYKHHPCKRQPRKPKVAYEHHAVAEVTE